MEIYSNIEVSISVILFGILLLKSSSPDTYDLTAAILSLAGSQVMNTGKISVPVDFANESRGEREREKFE